MATTVKIVYRKSTGFITIQAEQLSEDNDYIYLKCGKYLRGNIVSYSIISQISETGVELKDDA